MASSTPSASQQGNAASNTQPPAVDMSALLQGISPEQLAVIGHLFQTGQLQLPPQPPQTLVPTPSQDARPSTEGVNGVRPTSNGHVNGTAADKEEGEWDEDDMDISGQRDFLHPPPTGPRKRSPAATDRRRRPGDGKNRVRKPSVTHASPLVSARVSAHRQARRDAAKTFILAVHEAGFSFDDLAREVNDASLLGVLFHELGLGVAPVRKKQADVPSSTRPVDQIAPAPQPKASNLISASASQPADSTLPKADRNTLTKPAAAIAATSSLPKLASAIKKTAPVKPAEAGDRSAYLARLHALKSKAAAPASKASATDAAPSQSVASPTTEPPASVTAAKQTQSIPAAMPTATRELPASPAIGMNPPIMPAEARPKTQINTELVKQRLAALKEARTRKEGGDITPSSAQPGAQLGGASGSAMYNAVAQAVHAAAPGLSSQHVHDAVAAIASQSVQPTPLPTASVQDSSSSSAAQHMQDQPSSQQQPQAPFASPPVYSPSGASFGGLPGLPGLFMSGSPFGTHTPGLPLPSAPPTQTIFGTQPIASSMPKAAFGQTSSTAPSTYDSDSSSHLNSVFSPSDPGNSVALSASAAGVKRASAAISTYPSKRTFGKPVIDHVVIDNSDEEGEVDDDDESEFDEDDMDVEDADTAAITNVPAKGPGNRNVQNALPPSAIALPSPGSFAADMTSGSSTPGGTAYHCKLLEIQEMNKRIESMRAQKVKARGSSTPLQNGASSAVHTASTASFGTGALDQEAAPPAGSSIETAANMLVKADEALDKLSDSSTADEMDVSSEEDGEIEEDVPSEHVPLAVEVDAADEHYETELLDQDDDLQAGSATDEATKTSAEAQLGQIVAQPFEDKSSDDSSDGVIEEIPAPDPVSAVPEHSRDIDSSDASSIDDSDAEMYGIAQPADVPSTFPTSAVNTQTAPTSRLDSAEQAMSLSSDEESEDDYEPEDTREMLESAGDDPSTSVSLQQSAPSQDVHPPPTGIVPFQIEDVTATAQQPVRTKKEELAMRREKLLEEERLSEEARKARIAAKLATLGNAGMSRMEREAAAKSSMTSAPAQADSPGPQSSAVATDSEDFAQVYDLDIAPELQPARQEQGNEDEEPDEQPISRFTPYQTPLARFKNFRYHPEFNSYVPGGHKSLTYNNKIKDQVALCSTELDDSDLLRVYGTNNIPAGTPESKQRWKQGLGAVVKALRGTDSGKDVNAIADAIVKFRRDFLNAPDKVLDLGL
ncbi:hypothetical protein B0A48_17645 [Cryoendolithus antarcticus]|uniref:Uncharacterized protein n=1 Tax=Cryoendolithus antarcticus TaxID=1507870 RepID=A0A1V8SBF0_9PEZI|nr:hypothetical protein B0A48_17645 [Cryoendolithus antarcticus]